MKQSYEKSTYWGIQINHFVGRILCCWPHPGELYGYCWRPWLFKLMPLIYTVILIKLLPWYFLRRIVDWSLAMISLCLD